MKLDVTIYFKKDPKQPHNYDIDELELKRLANDFESYLKDGKPKGGVYRHYISAHSRAQKTLHLDFDTVVVIC